MWEQIKEDVVLSNARKFFCLYVQGLIFTRSFHLNLSIFFIKTCELQKSFLLGVTWTFGYNRHCRKALLWKSFGWKIQVNIRTTCIHGQGNGSSPEGSYLHLHETFVSLQPNFWSQVLKIDSSPLWCELEPKNVHWKAIDVSFYIGHEWVEGILVETLEPIWCVKGISKISKTWIIGWNFW